MLTSDWLELWLETYKKRKIRPKTMESYRRVLDAYILPALGDIPLEALTPEDCQMTINRVIDKGYTRQSQIVYTLLRAAFARAVKSRRLPDSPMESIDKPDHEKQHGRAMTAADQAAVLAVADSCRYWPGIALMLYAGLRRGEVVALTWGDIDLRAGVIHVQRCAVRVAGELRIGPTKSDAGDRIIPISHALLPILRAAHHRTPWGRVCGCAPETLGHNWRRLQQRAGIARPYTLHDLRHTCATAWVGRGMILKSAQYLLGHATLALTADLYAHADLDRISADFARIDALASLHQ